MAARQQMWFVRLPPVAAAVGASAPDPGGSGVLAWSTVDGQAVLWDGSVWQAVTIGGGGGGGVPAGGTTGQVLVKGSAADYDTEWGNAAGVLFEVGETPAGAVNGSNATFTAAHDFDPLTVEVFVNGMQLRRVTDFNTSGATTVTLTSSPGAGESVRINYVRA